jgi:hypothetical protein
MTKVEKDSVYEFICQVEIFRLTNGNNNRMVV